MSLNSLDECQSYIYNTTFNAVLPVDWTMNEAAVREQGTWWYPTKNGALMPDHLTPG